MRSLRFLVALGALAAGTLVHHPASAQSTSASPTGKGIAGCAMLGGELVLGVEAIAGVRPAWAYIVGGVIGAGGGGVGGYFVEQGGDARLSLYLLTGGMALIIPTTVGVLSATSYEPSKDFTEDQAPNEPPAEPAQAAPASATPPPAAEPAPQSPAEPAPAPPAPPPSGKSDSHRRSAKAADPVDVHRRRMSGSLVVIREGAVALSMPDVEVKDVYTKAEIATFGIRKQATEVKIPVVRVAF